jgi:RNA polymerase sigma-70 factor (ECF subfamily)
MDRDKTFLISQRTQFVFDPPSERFHPVAAACYATAHSKHDAPIEAQNSMTRKDLASILAPALPRLWVFALRVSGDEDDAEHLTHRACAQALEHVDQLDRDTIPLHWLYSIIVDLWARQLVLQRGKAVARYHEISIPSCSKHEKTPSTMEARLVNAVQQLPDMHRLVVILVAVEELNYSEASRVLNVPVETVACSLSQAHQAVDSALASPYVHACDVNL